MREDTVTTKVYSFVELSESAKENAIQNLSDINTDYEWWDSEYEDAANVGIKITGFDIGRGSYCKGDFTLDAEDVANKIIEDHGEIRETYKTAAAFLADKAKLWETHGTADDFDPDYEYYESDVDGYEDLIAEFEKSILEDYRIMLEKQYEYLCSEEAIIETIEANEYDFTEDGKLY